MDTGEQEVEEPQEIEDTDVAGSLVEMAMESMERLDACEEARMSSAAIRIGDGRELGGQSLAAHVDHLRFKAVASSLIAVAHSLSLIEMHAATLVESFQALAEAEFEDDADEVADQGEAERVAYERHMRGDE